MHKRMLPPKGASVFRVDKRVVSVGDQIDAARSYQNKVDPRGEALEESLERARPAGKLSRGEALFIFERYCDALKFWSNHPGASFLEVEIIGSTSHRGDMNITEKMHELDSNLEKLANDYWNGTATIKACWEYLTANAKVIRIISNSEKEREAVFNWIQGRDPVAKGLPDIHELMDNCYPSPPKAEPINYYAE
jgi:exonuclease VII small subunit